MVAIFARDLTDDLTSLVKQIDEQVEKNKDKMMKAYFVLLTDDPDEAESKLKELAEKHKISPNVPLTVFDGDAGPPNYKLAKDADVTVVMWEKNTVKVNHAFGKGQLDKDSVKSVVSDTSKILQ